MDGYIDLIENDHIKTTKINDKELYYFALENISNSWTGRIGAEFTYKINDI